MAVDQGQVRTRVADMRGKGITTRISGRRGRLEGELRVVDQPCDLRSGCAEHPGGSACSASSKDVGSLRRHDGNHAGTPDGVGGRQLKASGGLPASSSGLRRGLGDCENRRRSAGVGGSLGDGLDGLVVLDGSHRLLVGHVAAS